MRPNNADELKAAIEATWASITRQSNKLIDYHSALMRLMQNEYKYKYNNTCQKAYNYFILNIGF